MPHAAETALRPAIAQYDPAVQGAQALWPVIAWNVPLAQTVQASAETLEYSPDAQLTQTVAPAAANVPGAHAPVIAERPTVEQNDPAVHEAHELWPAFA